MHGDVYMYMVHGILSRAAEFARFCRFSVFLQNFAEFGTGQLYVFVSFNFYVV